MRKRIISIIVVCILAVALMIPAFAVDEFTALGSKTVSTEEGVVPRVVVDDADDTGDTDDSIAPKVTVEDSQQTNVSDESVIATFTDDSTDTLTYSDAAQTDTLEVDESGMMEIDGVLIDVYEDAGECEPEELPEIMPEYNGEESSPGIATYSSNAPKAFAIFDGSNGSLTFYAGTSIPTKGTTYGGHYVTAVYDGLEDTDGYAPGWHEYASLITDVSFDESFKDIQPQNCEYWFSDLENCTDIDCTYLDTSMVTDMRDMFQNCSSLTFLSVSKFDTSNVSDMGYMFYGCANLQQLNVSNFNTERVRNMEAMFYGCASLPALDVSQFDTSSVVNMAWMFGMPTGCENSFTSLNVEYFNTERVWTMHGMFCGCANIEHLGVKSFDTDKVTNMGHMFYGCSSLNYIYFGYDFNTENVVEYDYFMYWPESESSLKALSMDMSLRKNGFDLFTRDDAESSNLTDIKNWYDKKQNLVSDNYLLGIKKDGTYYTEKGINDTHISYSDTGSSSDTVQSATAGTQSAAKTSAATVKKDSDGKWYYYDVRGEKDSSYTGFAENSNGKWYVEKGVVTFNKNSVLKDSTGAIGTKDTWYYVTGSQVQENFTGLANYKNDNGWWYIKSGKVDFTHNGVDKNCNGWWYVTDGKVNFDYTGVANYKNDNGWWYIKKGAVDFTYTGFSKNNNGKWYVESGKVTFNKNSVIKDTKGALGSKNDWWYVEGSKVQEDYFNVANYKNDNGWWFIRNGKVDFNYTGLGSNKNGKWYCKNGQVDFSKNSDKYTITSEYQRDGTSKSSGNTVGQVYKIKSGKATRIG